MILGYCGDDRIPPLSYASTIWYRVYFNMQYRNPMISKFVVN